MSKPLVVVAHPSLNGESRINLAMAEVARQAGLPVHDLYACYPDFRIDCAAEQARMAEASALVLQFPLYWYAAPALLKEWLDVVLTYGFAYGREARGLRGKPLLLAVSVGSPEADFRAEGRAGASLDELLLPISHTFRYCDMQLEPSYAIFGVDRIDEVGLAAAMVDYRRRLGALTASALAEAQPVC
ncbi:NAD(P)H-dependent oxidoreductase [Chitinimonas lacunae]|uniref:NAD(P)H-dependent oxidoreductase n=1 Tax=Chitinimonas lacunae TaxID=1963018 RepID=A0ABV8MND3_9NEIS